MRPGRFVLYWMQASQRAHCNHALEFAIDLANEVSVPLVVLFGITDAYPEANARHYAFMLQGLAELRRDLEDRGIMFVLRIAPPEVAACELAEDACALITDRGYTRIQKRWREYVAEHALCRVIQVETDVVVPVEAASGKEEYAARTLRPRIHRLLPEYLVPLKARKLRKGFPDFDLASEDLSAPEELLARLDIDRSVPPVSAFRGGHSHAVTLLREFIDHKLDHYDELSNDPSLDFTSHLSPYLHFGQISPLEIALAVAQSPGPNEEAFLEQLIVRRELSMNFVQYNLAYDSYDCRRTGRKPRSQSTQRTHDHTSIPRMNSGRRRPTTRTGTRRSLRWSAAGRCTITCACTGARRSLSGRRRPGRPSTPRCA